MSERIDELLKDELQQKGYGVCPNCAKPVDRGDIAWNNAATDAGTGYSVIEIQCQRCDTELLNMSSWYPWIDDLDELLYVLELDLEPKPLVG